MHKSTGRNLSEMEGHGRESTLRDFLNTAMEGRIYYRASTIAQTLQTLHPASIDPALVTALQERFDHELQDDAAFRKLANGLANLQYALHGMDNKLSKVVKDQYELFQKQRYNSFFQKNNRERGNGLLVIDPVRTGIPLLQDARDTIRVIIENRWVADYLPLETAVQLLHLIDQVLVPKVLAIQKEITSNGVKRTLQDVADTEAQYTHFLEDPRIQKAKQGLTSDVSQKQFSQIITMVQADFDAQCLRKTESRELVYNRHLANLLGLIGVLKARDMK